MFGLLRLGLLIIWVIAGPPRTRLTLAAQTLNFLAAFPLGAVSFYEHTYRVAPSIFLELYLLLTIALDTVRLRTLWLIPGAVPVAAIEVVALVAKLGVALAEGWSKKSLIRGDAAGYSPEQLSGFYGRTFFLWLLDTLRNGNQKLSFSSLGCRYLRIVQATVASYTMAISQALEMRTPRRPLATVSASAGTLIRTRTPTPPCSQPYSSQCLATSWFPWSPALPLLASPWRNRCS